MIESKKGNIFDEQVQAIINPVNCVGVMGKGLALEFKERYPDNFAKYKSACDRQMLYPGKMIISKTGLAVPEYIINFPTKRHWRDNSRIDDIQLGLVVLLTDIAIRNIESIAIPPLGCGNGNLQWSQVKPLIESAFKQLPQIKVVIFEPR